MSDYHNGRRWFRTWKSLFLSVVLTALSIPIQLLAKISLNHDIERGPLYATIMCHLFMIYMTVCYVFNYNFLVKSGVINRSRKLFWFGITPLFIYELINILILIFV